MFKLLALLSVLAALGLAGCGGDGGGSTTVAVPAVKASCWTPEFAANPTNPDGTPLEWAKDPSPTHRHGPGAAGSNVCEDGTP